MYPLNHETLPTPLLAWPVLCLALIFAGTVLNLPVDQLPWAWPVSSGWNGAILLAIPMAMITAAMAAILAILAIKNTYKNGRICIFFEWISLQLLYFTALWIILPVSGGDDWIRPLGIGLLIGVLWLYMGSRKSWPATCSEYFFSAKDALPDSLFIILPLLTGYWVAIDFDIPVESGRLMSSVLLYPVYSLLQLSVFLVIPATRMIRMGYSSRTIAISCAMVFSLAHWPNPLLMVVTGIAMLVWAGQFLRGRSILVIALVMGLAATAFTFMVPRQWSWDMRIGPDYIEKRTDFFISTHMSR